MAIIFRMLKLFLLASRDKAIEGEALDVAKARVAEWYNSYARYEGAVK